MSTAISFYYLRNKDFFYKGVNIQRQIQNRNFPERKNCRSFEIKADSPLFAAICLNLFSPFRQPEMLLSQFRLKLISLKIILHHVY